MCSSSKQTHAIDRAVGACVMTCAASFLWPLVARRAEVERQPGMPALPAGHLRDAPPSAPACPAGACPSAASPTRLGPHTCGRRAGCGLPSPCARAPAFPEHAAPACTSPLEGGTAPHARPPTLSPGCQCRLLTAPGMSRVSGGQPSNAQPAGTPVPARARLWCLAAGTAAASHGRRRPGLCSTCRSESGSGSARWGQVNGRA